MIDKIKTVIMHKVSPTATLDELMKAFEQTEEKVVKPEGVDSLQMLAKRFLEEEKARREQEAKGAEKLYAYFHLNEDEKMAASVALTQGVVEAQSKLASALEEADSFIQSMEDVINLSNVDIDKVLNCILSDTEKVGGFGYRIRAKSLEER